jgi:hypothetical protein
MFSLGKEKKGEDPISKIPNTRKSWWSGSHGKVAEYLPRKSTALNSNPSTIKTKKNFFLVTL